MSNTNKMSKSEAMARLTVLFGAVEPANKVKNDVRAARALFVYALRYSSVRKPMLTEALCLEVVRAARA